MLSDASTYTSFQKNLLKKLQDNTLKVLKGLNDNNFWKYKFHNNQFALTNIVLAKCYGLPKIHEKDLPFRSIISLINSPIHFLAKIIYLDLKESIKVPKSNINNSFELKKKLIFVNLVDDYVLILLNVSLLFTNIPCDLILESLERRCHHIHNNFNIPFNKIINCNKFLFDNTYFTFNDKIYKQIFGTPMGSPISSLFANIVIDDFENDCLRIFKDNHNCFPFFYYRCVDDTILCVQKNILI